MPFAPSRRHALFATLLLAGGACLAAPDATPSADPVREALAAALDAKRGATLLVDGGSIVMVPTAIDERHVRGRNQQFERVVVRLDAIDAVQF